MILCKEGEVFSGVEGLREETVLEKRPSVGTLPDGALERDVYIARGMVY